MQPRPTQPHLASSCSHAHRLPPSPSLQPGQQPMDVQHDGSQRHHVTGQRHSLGVHLHAAAAVLAACPYMHSHMHTDPSTFIYVYICTSIPAADSFPSQARILLITDFCTVNRVPTYTHPCWHILRPVPYTTPSSQHAAAAAAAAPHHPIAVSASSRRLLFLRLAHASTCIALHKHSFCSSCSSLHDNCRNRRLAAFSALAAHLANNRASTCVPGSVGPQPSRS